MPESLIVKWFDEWHPSLDEALRTLPEKDNCPHELYRRLAQNPGPLRKRSALVSDGGTPVAVAVLRQRSRMLWEPVTQWITPGIVFPVRRSDDLMPVLEALGIEMDVGWWRMDIPPPESRLMRDRQEAAVHRIRGAEDIEGYWKKTGYWKTIRNKRNLCRDFKLTINAPGSIEWVVKNWEKKWRTGETEDPTLSDRMLAVPYLQDLGRHFTFRLEDDGVPLSGLTTMVHDTTLIAQTSYRDSSYNRFGVGIRLDDYFFMFGKEKGYEFIEIGAGHEYKDKWAPQEGTRYSFRICPEHIHRAKQVVGLARDAKQKVTRWLRDRR